MLKPIGFAAVFHQNGVIYAKKSHDARSVIIRSMDQVDMLAKKAALENNKSQNTEDDDSGSEDEEG